MKIRFYVDPETGAPHVHNHEVDEDEVAEVVAEVLSAILSAPGEDRVGRDGHVVTRAIVRDAFRCRRR